MTSQRSILRRSARVAVRGVRAYRERLPRVRVGSDFGGGTVYYLTPDFDEPAGGLRVFYRHVDTLNEAGVDAAILHSRPGFKCTWFDHVTRVTDTASARLGTADVLVVPEIYAGMLTSLPRGFRHVVFNQGPYLTFRKHRTSVAQHYATSSDLAVLTVSEHAADFLQYAFPDLDVRRVRLGLDSSLFHPADASGGRVITYMPRRGGADARLALQLLRGRGALAGWEVRPLQNLSHSETAQALRASSIFVNFTYQEGFGLPAVEAMACGNLVVGFHGLSGEEYFLPRFSKPVPTGDVLGLARTVEEVLAQEREEPGWCRSRGLEASDYVLSTYSVENERRDVVEFFKEVIGDDRVGRSS